MVLFNSSQYSLSYLSNKYVNNVSNFTLHNKYFWYTKVVKSHGVANLNFGAIFKIANEGVKVLIEI